MGRVNDSKIEQFLREAAPFARGSFRDNTELKKKILRDYFGRFQEGAPQDIDRYDAVRVGAIFSKLYEGYKKGRS